jgi:hypothetical protein
MDHKLTVSQNKILLQELLNGKKGNMRLVSTNDQEKALSKQAAKITAEVKGQLAAVSPTALAKNALAMTLREGHGANYTSELVPTPVDQTERPNPVDGESPKGCVINHVLLSVPATVDKGATFEVTFEALPNVEKTHWIGMYREGQPESAYLTYQWVSAHKPGAVQFTAPKECGNIFFRYFAAKAYLTCGISSIVHVGPRFKLKTTMKGKSELNVEVIPLTEGNYPNLWLGFYDHREKRPGSYLTFQYTQKSADFQIPKAGSYAIRCFPEKSFDFAAEAIVTVEGNDILEFSKKETGELVVSYALTTVDPKTDKVWIGIYKAEEGPKSTNYIRYKHIPDSNGEITLKALGPSDEGNYEARLFACGTYDVLCRSKVLSIVKPPPAGVELGVQGLPPNEEKK